MNSDHGRADRRLFVRWVRGTFFGYLLGFVLILVGGIVGDLVGLPGSDFMVGIGMGVGVGYMQGRALKPWLGAPSRWVWATAIGLGGLFLVEDLVAVAWTEFDNMHSLQLDVAIGGLLVGLLQRRILRSHSRGADWWIPASVAGWALAAWTASVTFSGAVDAVLNLGMILMGGVVLGVVTGGALVWVLRR